MINCFEGSAPDPPGSRYAPLDTFDVAGAAAEVAVQRLGNRLLEIGPADRRLRQALEKDLALVEEARRAIAALESEIINESLLQRSELTVLRMAFDGANYLPSKLAAGTMQVGLV